MQSNCQSRVPSNLHVAIIMDGNGRWAERRRLPRHAGHRASVKAVRRIAEAAPGFGVGTLTIYAFSVDNWMRPEAEVAALMGLLNHYLQTELGELVKKDVRLTFIGRRDRLPRRLAEQMARAVSMTSGGIAFDYSAGDAILKAAESVRDMDAVTRDDFTHLLNGDAPCHDVDLLIRTSGEQRLSDFLLWECAYAELYFTQRLWPDFDAEDLNDALWSFHRRKRRFGGLMSDDSTPEASCSMVAGADTDLVAAE